LDDEGIRDIADVVSSDKPLFGEDEDPSILGNDSTGGPRGQVSGAHSQMGE
jgi:hypothetical protein